MIRNSYNCEEDVLRDKCGVFAIYAPGEDVAKITYFALYSLQHRGQEGAGIAVTDGKKLKSIKRLGLVTSIFNEKNISRLKGFAAIGHNRYSTTGGNTRENTQPVIIPNKGEFFALGHNGNLVNTPHLNRILSCSERNCSTDSELMALLITQSEEKTWEKKILSSVHQFRGAYAVVAMSRNKIFAFRGPWGIRPLVIGKLNGYYVVASETCALDAIGARFYRDVEPGEIISIGKEGLKTVGKMKTGKTSFCLFEYVYLARPDSILNNELVHAVRNRSGKILAWEAPAMADIVAPIPDSGTSAAIGYASELGIPYGEVFIKNRYIGRTFIQPEQRIRELGVKIKFNPMRKIVQGKRIVLIDDSIVRGTTMKKIVEVLRRYGAKKIHIRVCSPPVKYSCYFGVDTPNRRNLIASDKNVEQIRKFIGADTLKYLSLDGLMKASRQVKNSLCAACFNGKYPMAVDNNFRKDILET